MLRRRVALLGLAALTTACTSPGSASACRSAPERVVRTTANPPGVIRDDAPVAAPDTDGDGRPDAIDVVAGQVVVRRGDGTVTFTEPGHEVALQTSADLDADGRDEVFLFVSDRPATTEGSGVFVVSGDVGPGERSPRASGVRIRTELAFTAGDLDGTPGDDLAELRRTGASSKTDVYDGAAVVAVGAGGDARGLRPTRRLRGLPRTRVALSPGASPEMLLLVPGEPAEVRFASRPRAVLRASLGHGSRVEDLFVFDEGAQRKIGLRVDDRLAVWAVPPACT